MPSNAILRAIPPAILCALASPALAEDPAAESAPVCATADLHESGIDWLKADPDYGAYLGGECLGCHTDAGAEGVPGISGIDPDYFYNALWEYCAGTRENAAMISVARSLDEEQMIALAAWFAERDPDGE